MKTHLVALGVKVSPKLKEKLRIMAFKKKTTKSAIANEILEEALNGKQSKRV